MFRSIWLKDFRSYGSPGVRLPLGKVLFLFGRNGSGKTSAWWVPALLSQTWASRNDLRDSQRVLQGHGPLMQVGQLQELFHGAKPGGGMEIGSVP